MPIEVGRIEGIYRYPVKSMRGVSLDEATLGWYGIDGDRRLAFRRIDVRGGNPWLSAGRLPELVSFAPLRRDDGDGLPTHVRTPEGEEMPMFGDSLAAEVGRRHEAPVEMMQLRHGIFDETCVSVIGSATAREIGRLSETKADVRRFRPNIVVGGVSKAPFEEDAWVGGVLTFGGGDDEAAVAVTMRDVRCTMINLDPDTARSSPEVMRACARVNENTAGIYCTVTRTGALAVGQPIFLHRAGS